VEGTYSLAEVAQELGGHSVPFTAHRSSVRLKRSKSAAVQILTHTPQRSGPVLCKSVTQPDAGDTVPRIDSLNLLHKLGYDT
jgi:hypothetical protein